MELIVKKGVDWVQKHTFLKSEGQRLTTHKDNDANKSVKCNHFNGAKERE